MLYTEVLKYFHSKSIHNKRVQILASNIAPLIPAKVKTVLDIGCGDGQLSSLILKHKKNQKLAITGLEVLKRQHCAINYKIFNGKKIPFKDNAVDLCFLVDVLHHTKNIPEQLAEVKRVSKSYIIIKDHIYINSVDFAILKFMDWVGNKPYGVGLIYNYQKKQEWLKLFKTLGLKVVKWHEGVSLYPAPFNLIFKDKFHFVVLLEKTNPRSLKK